MNLVLIIVDSWRQDHCGCYGNRWIHTPHLDRLAAESVVFTRAFPESLPTLPVRRALHTGRRTFPFHNHIQHKGDFVGAPGWGPMEEELDTLAEHLSGQGYRTAFVTDTYHQFKPSKNYGRGFGEWHWIRGQEHDMWRTGPAIPEAVIDSYLPPAGRSEGMRRAHAKYLMNVADRQSEEDYFPAQVFRGGADWLGRNADAEKFLLVLDSFDPHEPWDPPANYRRLYDPDREVANVMWLPYGAIHQYTDREMARARANYAGEVTLVDRWLGHFMESLERSGRLADTVVALISDHGHNLGDRGLGGKQGHPLTRAVADLVMMIRHPKGWLAGSRCDALCYNFDLTTTLLRLLRTPVPKQMQGIDLWPVAQGKRPGRDYVTIAWGPECTYIDDRWWCNATFWGARPLVHDLKRDPALATNLADQHPEVVRRAVEAFAADAGSIPEWLYQADGGPGCSPIAGKK